MTSPDKLLERMRKLSDRIGLEDPHEDASDLAELFDQLDDAMKQGRSPIEWMRHDIKGDVS